jgi:hypothetical protein
MSDLTTDFLSAEPEEHNFTVLPKGEYPFTILEINAFEQSRAGNDMLPLKLEFTGDAGATSNVYENLVFTEKAIFKINQFLAAVSIPEGTRINFRDPEFIKYLKVKTGRAMLDIESYQNKAGKTVKKNVVASFLYGGSSKRDEVPAHRAAPAPDPADDDDDTDAPF